MESENAAGPICDPRELVRLIHEGDVNALDRITRCYGDRLLAVGRRHCSGDDSARDAVQDALLSAGEHLEDFRGDGSVEGWLVRMVTNACRQMRRGRKNDPTLHSEIGDLELETTGAVTPEEAAGYRQLAAALGSSILRLEPRDRALLLLSDGEGWRGPELAEALGMKPAAVRARLSRARKRLREDLSQLWTEWSAQS